MSAKSKIVIYAALSANVAIAATKLTAAVVSGSSSMLTEGIHSLVDSGDQVLLLYGQYRARKPPDARHPLGYGRELYFWSFVVAILIFTAGAGVSVWEGVVHIRRPEAVTHPVLTFAVLGGAFVFESTSLSFAVREFLREKGDEGWWRSLRSSKNPSVFLVLLEDSAALIGIAIAAACIGLSLSTGEPYWDGLGSLLIGVVLGAVAIVLARECKGLLIGESASKELVAGIRNAVASCLPGAEICELLSVQLGPTQVVALLTIELPGRLDVAAAETGSERLEASIKQAHPEVERLFVRYQAVGGRNLSHAEGD